MRRKKAKKWIPRNMKKGAFERYCLRKGFKSVTNRCIEIGLKSKNSKTRHRALAAKNLRNLNK